MALIFPNPSTGGPYYKYPVSRRFTYATQVNRFLDDSEQRWANRNRVETFVLKYNNISQTDLTSIETFFNSQRGMYGCGWMLDFDGTQYTNCSFDTDVFSFRETMPNRYTIELPLKQVIPFAQPTPPTGATFINYPKLSNGAICQYPYTSSFRWLSLVNDNPVSAYRYSDYVRDNGLWQWDLPYYAITPAEADTLAQFFVWHQGRLIEFQFTDPRGVLRPKCRFSRDDLEIQYVGPNHFGTQIGIEEVK